MRLAGLGAALMKGNYPYVTARVKARKPKLLRRDDFLKMANSSPAEIARQLQEGHYKREIDELGGKYRGARLIEMATRLNLSRSYTEVTGYATGELQQLLLLYLQRYDVWNIKTVIRGKFAGVRDEEIESQLIPAGALHTEELGQLVRLGSVDEVIERLAKTPYGDLLREGLEGGKRENLARVENDLDKRYYYVLLKAVQPDNEPKRAFLHFLRYEADILDLKTILRLRAAQMEDATPYLVDPDGGDLDGPMAARLLRAAPDEFVREVEATPFGAPLVPALNQYFQDNDLNKVTLAMDKVLMASAQGFSRRYPLSLLPVVDYVLRKKLEVDNLRILAAGKEHGLPDETIRGLLIL
jgi:V/A-type H+/Na+-transporting ATPase subunit C